MLGGEKDLQKTEAILKPTQWFQASLRESKGSETHPLWNQITGQNKYPEFIPVLGGSNTEKDPKWEKNMEEF